MKNSFSKPMLNANKSVVSKGMNVAKFALVTMLICFISILPVFANVATVNNGDIVTKSSNVAQSDIVKELADGVVTNQREYMNNVTSKIADSLGDGVLSRKLKQMVKDGSYTDYLTKEQKAEHDKWVAIQEEAKEREKKVKQQYEAYQKYLADQERMRKERAASSRKYVNRYSDLSNREIYITPEEMNKIIEKWERYNGGSPFHGHGDIFVKASEESGLDPIYILAHASWESDWGRSYLARTKGNYFGINAVDTNPGNASHMGNTMSDGIINGAKWISRNYYQEGSTSLNAMIYGKKRYASGADYWISGINSIMSDSYGFLNEIRGR